MTDDYKLVYGTDYTEPESNFSSSDNGLKDAAMLIELGMRRLGFNLTEMK